MKSELRSQLDEDAEGRDLAVSQTKYLKSDYGLGATMTETTPISPSTHKHETGFGRAALQNAIKCLSTFDPSQLSQLRVKSSGSFPVGHYRLI